MPTKTEKAKENMKAYLVSIGYTEDRWGHMKKTGKDGKLRRYKMQATSWRLEIKSKHGDYWLRFGGNYYTKTKLPTNA